MPSLPDVVAALERIAPERLAAEWDSVGLLVAPRDPQVRRVLTCLTLTPEVAAEASWPRTTITPTLSGWILASLAPVGSAWTRLESSCSWDPMAWALVS